MQMAPIKDMPSINLRLVGDKKEIQRLHHGLQKELG